MSEIQSEILFVDSDIGVLKSLEQLLRNESWNCQFITDAHQALKIVEQRGVDLIVSEVQLPHYDGIELLERIRRDHPHTVRMFLTAQADQKHVTKALVEGLTQQIIPKPWIDQELKEILRSALRQKRLQYKRSPAFQTLINSIALMPALPNSYSNVRSCITVDEVDIERMATYISEDVAISTALLHWANSALFGQRFQVDTIKKAIIVLGTDIVENLILSEAINRTIAGKMPAVKGFDNQKFKTHSIATAVLSRLLVKSLHASDSHLHDRAFVSGLLHDMGKLAAATFFPSRFEQALALSRTKRCSLSAAEMKTYGSHHAEIGAFLAEWWTLPPVIVNAIQWHNKPQSSPVDQEVIIATYVANRLSYRFNYGCNAIYDNANLDSIYLDKFFLNEEAMEILHAETDKVISVLSR